MIVRRSWHTCVFRSSSFPFVVGPACDSDQTDYSGRQRQYMYLAMCNGNLFITICGQHYSPLARKEWSSYKQEMLIPQELLRLVRRM